MQARRQQQQPKKEQPESLSALIEKRKLPLIASGLAAAVLGGYIMMLVVSMTGEPEGPHTHDACVPSGRTLDLRRGKISATSFDRDLDRPESLIGVRKLRGQMGGLARGHVLEVAVGTGRNIEWIDWDEVRATAPPVLTDHADAARLVKSPEQLQKERVMRRIEKDKRGMVLPGDETPEVLSYTGVDVSTDVLEVAWGKLKKAVPELIPRKRRKSKEDLETEQQQERSHGDQAKSWVGKAVATINPSSPKSSLPSSNPTGRYEEDMVIAANIGQGRIRLYKSDAQTQLPPPPALTSHDSTKIFPAPRYYDTILQNFGLCSVSDPQRLLSTMAAMLQPGTGRIYLLEHGRGSYGWLNGLLDKFAPSHFQRYGCWWNRDIEEIVRRAEQEVPGLEVVRIDRPLWLQGGTMLWVELRVNPDKLKQQ